jgi:glycosyltransferase involved in cell wall biosynthesis
MCYGVRERRSEALTYYDYIGSMRDVRDYEKVTISIIIPTFNRREIVRELLLALRDDKRSHDVAILEVIVADDLSTDGTSEMLAHHFPEVKVVLGPGKSAPLAKRAAIEVSTGDYIVSLDDDSIPRPGWIEPVLGAISRGEKLIQSRIIFVDQGQEKIDDESKKNFRVGFRWTGMPLAVLNGGFREQYIPICHEFGFFIARDVLRKIPFNDPNLVVDYGESASFYLRAKKLGYKVFFEPKSVIDHLGALHGGCIDRDKKITPKKNCSDYSAFIVRNFVILTRMRNALLIPLLIPYYIAGGFYLSIRQRKPCYKYFIRGLFNGLTHRFVPTVPYNNFR